MAEAKAELNNYRQSPRKVRVVADTVRGKKAEEAITLLSFMPKRPALPLQKLISSAIANAKNLSLSSENLVVKKITVDAGSTLFRRRPRSRGMANPIRKRTSHISVTLADDLKPKIKNKPKKSQTENETSSTPKVVADKK